MHADDIRFSQIIENNDTFYIIIGEKFIYLQQNNKKRKNYMAKRLSKSRYTTYCQCPQALWLKVYKPDEAAASRTALLEYCKLDTWAMVKVWEKLKEATE